VHIESEENWIFSWRISQKAYRSSRYSSNHFFTFQNGT